MNANATPPVDDLAVLRDFRASQQRVVDEEGPISDHVRPLSCGDATGETAEHVPSNVAVTVCAGAEILMLAGIARDMEANGDVPMLHWYRDEKGIRGVILVGHLSAETKAGMR